MSEWRIEYDNDTGPGDESFHEWWTVTDGSRHFRCNTESDANFLFDRLSEWKPIETAPKEHRDKMLVWEPRDGVIYTAIRFNDRHGNELRLVPGYDDRSTMNRCTHWMHLPAPPVTD